MDEDERRVEAENPNGERVKQASARRLEANRRNAARSTGPRTAEGKNAIRLNAAKHGLCSKEVVIQAGHGKESEAEFRSLLAQVWEDCQPAGFREEALAEEIAICYWRLRRAYRCEKGEIQKGFALLTSNEPLYSKDKLDAAKEGAFLPGKTATDNIVRYETTIKRHLYRAMDQLERLQRRRQGEHVPAPINIEVSTEK